VSVASSETLKGLCTKSSWVNSSVTTAVYTIGGAGYSDAFTGTGGTALSAHDAQWVQAINYTLANFTLDGSGHLRCGPYVNCGARYALSSADVSQVTFKGQTLNTTDSPYPGVILRSSATHGYQAWIEGNSSGNFTTLKIVRDDGSAWYRNTSITSLALSRATDHVIRATATTNGNQVDIAVYLDGSLIVTQSDTDAARLLSGNPGVEFGRENSYNTNNGVLDDWQDY
jgi:hypothetical protein